MAQVDRPKTTARGDRGKLAPLGKHGTLRMVGNGSEMNLTRSFAAAATFAAVAVGAAAPASAAPVMSGHYIKTTTDPAGGGRTFTEH